MKCTNARLPTAVIFIIQTKGTEQEGFKREMSLKICRMIGNAFMWCRDEHVQIFRINEIYVVGGCHTIQIKQTYRRRETI